MPGISLDHERQVITYSQSWIRSYLTCPESARREMVDPASMYEDTDATLIGTALHTYAEARFGGASIADAQGALESAIESGWHGPSFRAVQVQNIDTAIRHATACARSWETELYPQLVPAYVEYEFDTYMFHYGDYEVRLKGAVDMIEPWWTVWDWKSAGRAYEAWEYQRWAIQPTAYGYGVHHVLGAPLPLTFNYAVFVKPHGTMQVVEVQRDAGHLAWFEKQVLSITRQVMTMEGQPEWPMNDQHALCSEKWCKAWSQCKGKYLTQTSTSGID